MSYFDDHFEIAKLKELQGYVFRLIGFFYFYTGSDSSPGAGAEQAASGS